MMERTAMEYTRHRTDRTDRTEGRPPAPSVASPTFGSLFVGGLDWGFERAGLSCSWRVGLDGCHRFHERHRPGVRRHDDVRTFPPGEAEEWRVDVVCGGFPLQDVGSAGRRAGGARPGLWGEFARVVRALRPRFVVVEDVAAIRGRGLDRVCGDLASCGYDAEWDCLPAAFDAPFVRDRLFLVAHRPDDGWGALRVSGLEGDAARLRQLARRAGAAGPPGFSWWAAEHGPDRPRAFGNRVAPHVAELIGRRIRLACAGPEPGENEG
jgi:site-specific DNA-cytosine methylase